MYVKQIIWYSLWSYLYSLRNIENKRLRYSIVMPIKDIKMLLFAMIFI